jgi:UDP-N-acetylmuramyl pentapeptide phosphotransferase/UDP-N-acetylglucosamine-1-phosphate transferase
MAYMILAFFCSLLISLGLIRYQHLHETVSSDYDFSGPQKFHTHAVPRIGGVSIFVAITFSGLIAS